MKSLALRGMNKIGNALSEKQRRFVLGRLGVASLLDSFAGEEFEEIALPNGLRLSFSPVLHAQISKHGELAYEDHVVQALEDCLSHGDVFYDAGANVGVFALLAATLVGEKGTVHAFEPEPNNLLCFQRSLDMALVHNIELHDIALGGADGTMAFDRRGGAFQGRLAADTEEAESEGVCEIEVRTIDSLLAEGLPPPDLIKVDVMGGEGPLLQGARRTLQRHKPTVLCEIYPGEPESAAQAFAVLREAGYRCQILDEGVTDATGDAPEAAETVETVDGPLDRDRPYHILARAA